VHLTKHHGLGNDFLVVLDETNADLPEIDGALARRLCDRRTGIGADGLIHGEAAGSAGIVMHLFNSDGSPAEVSGNGLRCLAQAVALAREDPALHLVVGTDAGAREAVVDAPAGSSTAMVTVDMGVVGEGAPVPAAVAARVAGKVRSVDAGNPHLVVLGPDPHAVDLAVEGPWIDQQVDGGVNTEWIAPAGPDAIDLTVWERGAGITQACGSGACAGAWAAHEWGLVGSEVAVRMPGGSATVILGDTAQLVGPAVLVATLVVDDG
jgi:diaminopimelate epimerase